MEKEKRKLENFQYHKKIDISAGCVKEKKERSLMVQRGAPFGRKGARLRRGGCGLLAQAGCVEGL
ncbi:hypothetical protein [uncultured Dialister sp.]|uniref:hypothetical protein n=1 Tax=uncultured Dialister sp. TaxID=278064 RepID=UPI0025DD4DEC|nr:hypothetical protein [uncultured Dialister sp.]